MNKFINERIIPITPLLLIILLLGFTAGPADAQEGNPQPPDVAAQQAGNRGEDLIPLLGLTPDQIGKIRSIRQQNREEQRLAGERLRSAQRALDDAIYSDEVNEAVIEERSREVAAAQTAVVRQRVLTELGIRRILTPEQIKIWRDIRGRQAQQRRSERRLNQPRLRGNQPGNNDAQPTFPRDRFRQRQNAAPTPTNGLPATAAPERRRANIRKGRP